MNDAKDIIQLTQAAVSKMSDIEDIIDSTLSPITDYTDTVSELVTPVRALVGFYSLAKRRKFKAFLKTYAERVHSNINPDHLVIRLERYLRNTKNLELISEIVDSAIDAHSVECSSILGFFAGEILSGDKQAEYSDFIVINALESLVDEDIKYFITLFESIPQEKRYEHYRVYEMNADIAKLGLERFHLELTLEKLKNNHIIGFDVGGLGNLGNSWGAFKFNEITDYFYTLLKKCGVE